MAGIWQVRVKKSSDGRGRNRRGVRCMGEHMNDMEAKIAWVLADTCGHVDIEVVLTEKNQ